MSNPLHDAVNAYAQKAGPNIDTFDIANARTDRALCSSHRNSQKVFLLEIGKCNCLTRTTELDIMITSHNSEAQNICARYTSIRACLTSGKDTQGNAYTRPTHDKQRRGPKANAGSTVDYDQ